jgi:ribosomal protein L19
MSLRQVELLKKVEASSLRENKLSFEIGDTVNVHTRILEEGDKERIQIFSGVVIARRGAGTREMFTVRRIVAGEGVERIPRRSPSSKCCVMAGSAGPSSSTSATASVRRPASSNVGPRKTPSSPPLPWGVENTNAVGRPSRLAHGVFHSGSDFRD